MQQAEILRNEALGATLVKKLKLRGFDAYYCAEIHSAHGCSFRDFFFQYITNHSIIQ